MVAVCLAIFVVCFTPMNVVRSVGLVVQKFLPHKCSLLLKVETAYYVSWILAGANAVSIQLSIVSAVRNSQKHFISLLGKYV